MQEYNIGTILAFAINAILIENIVLTQFMGCCPFFGVSKNSDTALGMGMAVTFIMGLSSIVTYGIYQLVLVPLKLEYLETIAFILVIASLVQLVEMALKKLVPALYNALGIYLPLITTNCAVLGICLTNIQNGYDFLSSFLSSIFTAIGFTLAIWIFSIVRTRMEETCDIPKAFQGFPIALITAALLSFGFMGFNGLTL
ncbi:MAG: RnfABCDGE type electron transport complex subunit A [Clostridia bacterium]|nr:RnfABCDGE type electron transport complex subunit A [Clostridia bacterium]